MSRVDSSSRLGGVAGVRVGHWTGRKAMTGCTAVLFERSCPASVHVAGGAPGSQETDLLEPSCLVGGVDAIMLTGGSAFGLACAAGMKAHGGALGVGRAVQEAVKTSILLIIVLGYIITWIFYFLLQ